MPVKLVSAGGGGVILQPASSIGSDVVLETPVTPQRLIGDKTPGTVLQVVNSTFGTYTSTTLGTPVDTGLSATITPTSSTSKILMFASINGVEKSSNCVARFYLFRDSTEILSFENAIYSGSGVSGLGYGNTSTSFLDSPATTSAIVYKVRFNLSGAASGTLYINNYSTGGNGTTKSTLTLMEIAA